MNRALCLVVASLALGGCHKHESPEEQIRKVLDDGAAALEARDAKKAAEVLSDAYKDDAGRDKQKVKGLAFFALQQGPVLVSLQKVDIKVDGDHAAVALKVLAVQGNPTLKTAADLLPSNARAFDLTLSLAHEDDGWRVTAIDGLHAGGLE